jgi:uncharacterized protein
MTPVSNGERIDVIDIIRGIALFGILAANMRAFGAPAAIYGEPWKLWPALPDRIAQACVDTFVQGKFITIFAFLFGAGFAIQLDRAEARGARFVRFYARRLAVLAAIGLIHGLLIWYGDILLPYALTGYLMILLRKKKDSTLLTWGIVGQLVPAVLMAIIWSVREISGRTPHSRGDKSPEALLAIVRGYAEGSWREIQRLRMTDVFSQNWGMFLGFVVPLLGLFALGTLAWRHRFFTPPPEALPAYRRMMVIGYVIGIAGNAGTTAAQWAFDIPSTPAGGHVAIRAIQAFAVPALSFAYVCSVILVCQDDAWRRRLAPFAAVGRTALSNYLLQSVICTMIFYSYGLGLFGTVGPARLLLPTVGIYAVQTIVSSWWLEHFRFGPAEWVWRSLTYGRAQEMGKP